MKRALLLAVALAACGNDTPQQPDAGDDTIPCTATFAGNFAETSTDPANCATVATADTGSTLMFAVPIRSLKIPLTVMIDLGATATTGGYTSQSTATWAATATTEVGGRHCYYTAGSATVPHGSFELTLDAVADGTAHGKLSILQYVLADTFAQCGPHDNETVTLAF